MKNKKLFMEYMTGLSVLHDKDITPVITEIYWKALEPFTDAQCKAAFDTAIVKNKFFPKPAELLENMEPPNKFMAQQQAGYLINAISNQEHRNPKDWKNDPTTVQLLATRFNIQRLKDVATEDEVKWIEKNFIEAYENSADYVQQDSKAKIEATKEVLKLTENIGNID